MNEQLFEKDMPEQVKLARRNGLATILNSVPEINGNERMLLRKMTRVLYVSDPSVAKQFWDKIPAQTPRQEKALAISDADFADAHDKGQVYLQTEGTDAELEEMIRSYREKTSPRGPGYRWNDNHQVSQKERRSVAQLQQTGIRITVPPEGLTVLGDYMETRPEVALLETGKNDRFAVINGFKGTLMTLLIHDPYDHLFTASFLRAQGLEGKYQDFFNSVGRPHDTDLFSREGELIASIAYTNRAWTMLEPGIQPDITADRVNRAIKKSPKQTANQQEASQFLEEKVLPDAGESRKYGYMVTGVVIELLEQRRKQGFIRTIDSNGQITGSLPLMDPEYLSLIVETTKALSESDTRARASVGNMGVLIEEYLRFVASPEFITNSLDNLPPNLEKRLLMESPTGIPTLRFDVDDMSDDSITEKTSVPKPLAQWIIKNPGFTATQQPLV